MTLLLTFAVLLAGLFGLACCIASRWRAGTVVMFFGSVLSVIRVSSLWIGSALLSATAGPGQVIGYWLVLFTLPEALIVRGLRNDPLMWKCSLSLLVIMGSFLAGAMLAGLRYAVQERKR
jgi:hypothetical protein